MHECDARVASFTGLSDATVSSGWLSLDEIADQTPDFTILHFEHVAEGDGQSATVVPPGNDSSFSNNHVVLFGQAHHLNNRVAREAWVHNVRVESVTTP